MTRINFCYDIMIACLFSTMPLRHFKGLGTSHSDVQQPSVEKSIHSFTVEGNPGDILEPFKVWSGASLGRTSCLRRRHIPMIRF